ncbi:replication initiator protein A [Salipiger aestuarii]|uniref:replication initiator protein A n=1 Tax=Salipiger aestuarii TaxID=568098 RepID=UPI0012389540|nr:replication initiator protein A [Salipiger aestuarii]KAA8607702.1 plasmid replication initiator RepA [Salipiger aestuarii]
MSSTPLLPDRHPTPDFFLCDIFDAAPKADMASMEHPLFSLSTKPDTVIREYSHRGLSIKVTPSVEGLATVHDRDILIYCISQIIRGMNDGRPISRTVRFQASELLKATNRMTTGRGYELLKASMRRLQGTQIETNIVTGGQEVFEVFGLIEKAKVVRETRDGRMQEIEIVLSEWVFNAIEAKEVLTLSRDYFRLRKPLERRLYELGRKHCGTQTRWTIGFDLLQKKCGSSSSPKKFRELLNNIIEEDEEHSHMPDYSIRWGPDRRTVVFYSRGSVPSDLSEVIEIPKLDPDVYEMARQAAPGWDVRMIEQEWRAWAKETPKNPEMAFLGFCRKWSETRGRP